MNIIDAICNVIERPVSDLKKPLNYNNRANAMGDALELYVKDMFAGTFYIRDEYERLEKWNEVFSYLGNTNNPPDAMLKGGDAIEVKKIASDNSALALNSSYPKQILSSSSPMISAACRSAEEWDVKDMIYTVGVVKGVSSLKHLCMVYGIDYCASESCYSRIKETIKDGVESIPGIEFAETRELGHINRVDPLGITYMRVRGMWGIDNPWKVFSYIYTRPVQANTTFMFLISKRKWDSFNNTERLLELNNKMSRLKIEKVKVKNPDNPALFNDSILVTYWI